MSADFTGVVLAGGRSSRMGRDKAALPWGHATLLDRMVDADLVSRVPCPTDRRVVFAALTPRGEHLLEQASALHTRDLRQVFDGFDAADLPTLDDLLDRLRTAHVPSGGGRGDR